MSPRSKSYFLRPQFFGGDDKPVLVAVQPLPGMEGNATQHHGNIHLAHAGFPAFSWVGAERLHSNTDAGERGDIAHGAVDHHTSPTVLLRQEGNLIADERRSQVARAVHHEDLALPASLQRSPHQHIVVVALHRANHPAKAPEGAEVAKL